MTYFLQLSYRCSLAYRDIPGPATSNEVGGLADIIKSEITMSLALLKEASSLASKLPCISVIAGMLLYYIQMHDVRVLSLFRETLLIVHAIRIFDSAKRSGW
jgi:hypothetical protein